MALYRYTARNNKGELLKGLQDAATESAAVNLLQSQGLLVTKIAFAGNTAGGERLKKKKRNRIISEDLIFFISQTAMLLESGIPLIRSIEIIADLTESKKMADILMTISANIRAGSTFKDSLARHPRYFPAFWPYLIEAGEASGSLPAILKELAKNLESAESLKKKVVSALVYPGVLIACSIGVVLLFMLRIIPIFQKIFAQFNAKLPPLTQAIINVSNFTKSNFLFVAAGVALLFFLLKKYASTPTGKNQLDRMILSMPIIGNIMSDVIHARICIILFTVVKSGLNLLKSLEITQHAAGNSVFENAITSVSEKVQQGKTLAAALREDNLFSPMMIHLITIGEESGELPKMIAQSSKYFEEKVDVLCTRLGTLIEPIILIFVGALIGVLALGLFLPLFSLSSNIH